MTTDESIELEPPTAPPSRTETFLQTVEAKISDPIQRRILLAARSREASEAMEAELSRVITEILNEA